MAAAVEDVALLTQHLADAQRRVDRARAQLEIAQGEFNDLERDLAAAQAKQADAQAKARPAEAARPVEAKPAATEAAPAAAVEPEAAAAEPEAAPAVDDGPPPLTEEEKRLHAELDAERAAMTKRGFRRGDLYYHQCPTCKEQAVEKWELVGKPGGRDIDLCLACGKSWSWRRRPEREDREVDPGFVLWTFLRL